MMCNRKLALSEARPQENRGGSGGPTVQEEEPVLTADEIQFGR